MARSALVTGATGQDGSYLMELLLKKGYEVYGLVRRLSVPNIGNIQHILEDVTLLDGDLIDQSSLNAAVRESHPDEIYSLAAQSFVATSFVQPVLTGELTGLGVVRRPEGPGVPHTQGQSGGRSDPRGAGQDDFPWELGRQAGLGLRPGIRGPDVADPPAQGTGRLCRRDRGGAFGPRVRRGSLSTRRNLQLGEARDNRREEHSSVRGVQPARGCEQGEARPRVGAEDSLQGSRADHGRGRNRVPRGYPAGERSSERLGPRGRGKTGGAVGIDVPHALVVLAKAGRQHEIGTKLVDARDLLGEGHASRDALRETVDERLDLREEADHFLIDAPTLGVVMAHGGLCDPHRVRDVNLLHLVRPEELPREPRADRRQQLGDH